MKTRNLIFILLPAILLAGLAVTLRILQYEPLYPDETKPVVQKSNTDLKIIPIYKEDPILGNKKSLSNVVIFEDLACSHCKDIYVTLHNLLTEFPDKFKVTVKLVSVIKFPYATDMAHEYAYCANKQGKYDEFANIAFSNGDNLSKTTLGAIAGEINLDTDSLNTCLTTPELKDYNAKNLALASTLNIQSVPAIFLNNLPITTPSSEEEWKNILNLNK